MIKGETLGERIKYHRKEKFGSQGAFITAFQKAFGWKPSQPTVSHWESGETEPSLIAGYQIAHVLGVSVYELIGAKGMPLPNLLGLPKGEVSKEALLGSYTIAIEYINELKSQQSELKENVKKMLGKEAENEIINNQFEERLKFGEQPSAEEGQES